MFKVCLSVLLLAYMGVAMAAETAIFAGGCFWCMESDFEKLPGVSGVISGYTGGVEMNPSYNEVSSGSTGHAEAVEVTFDPDKISYQQLLDHFWKSIDPTVKDRQFCDVGKQYRTAIFTDGAEQAKLAQASKAAIKAKYDIPIETEIVASTTFYPAEEYHQDYYKKNPIRYRFYRMSCGRDKRLKALWDK